MERSLTDPGATGVGRRSPGPDRAGDARGRSGRRRALRLLGGLLGLAVLGAVALVVRDRWGEVGGSAALDRPVPLLGALALHVAGNALLVQVWRAVLRTAGAELGYGRAAWAWATSQLARYTLGAAQVAGRAVVARRYGVGAGVSVATTIVEVVWQAALIAALAVATLPWWLDVGGGAALAWVAVVPLTALVAVLVTPQRVVEVAVTLLRRVPVAAVRRRVPAAQPARLDRRAAWAITGLLAATTTLRVVAFLLVLGAVTELGGALVPVALGAYAVGQLAGRVAVFAPGGLGPQEGATALVLAPSIGGGAALVVVAVVRLIEVVAEVLFVALARGLRGARPPLATDPEGGPSGLRER